MKGPGIAINFQVVGVEVARNGLMPFLHFRLQISNQAAAEKIYGVFLNAQIQFRPSLCLYGPAEKAGLVWMHSHAVVGAFIGRTEAVLSVPCTFDLNITSPKYFYTPEGGSVSLLFLFSGSVFYATSDGWLQIERISRNNEFVYQMTAHAWQGLMAQHYPNGPWLAERQNIFDRRCDHKRNNTQPSSEQVIRQLLPAASTEEDV